MEVGWAADIVVRYRRPVRGHCGPSAIEVVLQDRVDGCRHNRRTCARPRRGSAAWSATVAPPRRDRARRNARYVVQNISPVMLRPRLCDLCAVPPVDRLLGRAWRNI